MRIIKLNAIDSTNSFLKQLCAEEVVQDYTIVTADLQTQGRGQMGTKWLSNNGENLMFSVVKDVSFLKFDDHFSISMIVALALIKTLKQFNIPKLKIKWPNDILSADKKICGILIENSIKKNAFKDSIIGIGLNVNQIHFETLPKASSLCLITGKQFDTDELLHAFIGQLKQLFKILEVRGMDEIRTAYDSYLFRKNKPSTFKNEEGVMFSGIIQTVLPSGKIQILLEDNVLKEYDLKEITLLY